MMAQQRALATATQILQQLSSTPYACSSLSQLSSRPANAVYRGILVVPISYPGVAADSVIIKQSSDALAKIDEAVFGELLLTSLADLSSLTSSPTTIVKAPRLLHCMRNTNTQVLEDYVNTDGFKWVLFSPRVATLLPEPASATIGHHLGSWLRSFHDWASAAEQVALRAQMWQNNAMRKVKYRQTYGSVLEALEDFPDLMRGHRAVLEEFQGAMAKEFEKRIPYGEEEGWGLVHADFWSGNILIPTTPWEERPPPGEPNRLYIIDWEFAQFGHRSYDLGQIIGDFYERKVFYDSDVGLPTMEGTINGYGKISDDMAYRTAIYVGVHLISWYTRMWRKNPKVSLTKVTAGLTVGRDFMLKGLEHDKVYFKRSALASVFTATEDVC